MAKYVKQFDTDNILVSSSKLTNRQDLGIKITDSMYRRIFFSAEKKTKINGTGVGVTSFKVKGKLKDFNLEE